MSKRFLIILILILSYFTISYSQENRLYIDFSDPVSVGILNNPRSLEKYSSIYVKNTETFEQLSHFLESIHKIETIESIIITDYFDKKIPESLSNCKYLRKVSLLNCKDLNVKSLFKFLGKLPALEVINLGNCKIEVVPPEIKQCTQLRSINISMNNMIDLAGSIEALSNCPNLTAVSLPVNQISEIPDNISLLKNLKELNLSNNNLTDLPNSMLDMENLENLYLEKNIILTPDKTYEKINPLNIKYLSIDEVTEEELAVLRSRFPNAEILQSEKPTMDIYEIHHQIKDSITKEILEQRELEEQDPYVVKKRESLNLKAFSLAYLHYAKMFDPILNSTYFRDSLNFDERYLDTNYYNIYRRQPGIEYDGFYLKPIKGSKQDQIWFNFEITEYFYYHFPEYFAFNDMSWVLIDPQKSKKEVYQSLFKKRKFTDFRLYYNELEKHFILELKYKSSFEKITVIPRFNKNKHSASDEQSSYELRYVKYLELLNKRAHKFNKELKDKQNTFRLEMGKIQSKAWSEFSDLHLSKQEKQMTQEEWLEYYDDILKNEEQALLNANMNIPFMLRYLEFKKYKLVSSSDQKSYYPAFSKVTFVDADNQPLNITEIYTIDNNNHCYKYYPGSNAPMEFYLFHEDKPVTILAVLRNGDFAMSNGEIKILNAALIPLDIYPSAYTQLYDLMLISKSL